MNDQLMAPTKLKRSQYVGLVLFTFSLVIFFTWAIDLLTQPRITVVPAPSPEVNRGALPAPAIATNPTPSPGSVIKLPGGGGLLGANGTSARTIINIDNIYNFYDTATPIPSDSPSPSPTPTPSSSPAVLGDYFASASYSIVESMTGGTGSIPGSSFSTNFVDGGSTIGDTAVGRSDSAHYRSQSGFDTTPDPRLEFVVDTDTVDLGDLHTNTTGTGTATFNVLAYNASGYVVRVIGTSPYNGSHYIDNLTTDTASIPGTEQFGLNTVANTSPAIGANPVQVPSSIFSYGVSGDGFTTAYTIPNQFRFNSNEIIASAPSTSGVTDYTISFIGNVSVFTPSGHYSTALTLVATGTF
jgi:hypothetical protein